MKFTDKQKAKAVELYLTEGASAAAEAVGCSRQAVYTWLGEFGVDSVQDEQKRAATVERHVQKRASLSEAFADQALALILAADPAVPLDAQRLATAAAIASDKHLLLSVGSAKGASFGLTSEMPLTAIDFEMERILDEHRRAAEHETTLDRELKEAIAEMEERTRQANEIIRSAGQDPGNGWQGRLT